MNAVRTSLGFAAFFLSFSSGSLRAQTSPILPSQKVPLSERVVAYQIEANYHAQSHSLDGQETLTWTNYTGQPQDRLPFHLYLNAFQLKSTFAREAYEEGSHRVDLESRWDEKRRG